MIENENEGGGGGEGRRVDGSGLGFLLQPCDVIHPKYVQQLKGTLQSDASAVVLSVSVARNSALWHAHHAAQVLVFPLKITLGVVFWWQHPSHGPGNNVLALHISISVLLYMHMP